MVSSNQNKGISEFNPLISRVGTAFPVSPAANQRFFRTDRGIEYFWNGTYWLSTGDFPVPLTLGTSISTATTSFGEMSYPKTIYSLYLESIEVAFQVATTFNATNYWNLYSAANSGAGALIFYTAIPTWETGRLAATTYPANITINTAVNSILVADTNPATFKFFVGKDVGSPGQITVYGSTMWYRLIG